MSIHYKYRYKYNSYFYCAPYSLTDGALQKSLYRILLSMCLSCTVLFGLMTTRLNKYYYYYYYYLM